jgi:uncharacterized membrane protein
MWVVWALLLVALVLVVLTGFRRRRGSGTEALDLEATGGRTDDAEEILKKRLARGEISEGEFERQLRHMRA